MEVALQIVHFADEMTGSIDWELPVSLADRISTLSAEDQKNVLALLEAELKGFLLLLFAAATSGHDTPAALGIIAKNRAETATTLARLVQR